MQTRECRRCAAEYPAQNEACPLCGFVHVGRPIYATLRRVVFYGVLLLVGLAVCVVLVIALFVVSGKIRSQAPPSAPAVRAVAFAGAGPRSGLTPHPTPSRLPRRPSDAWPAPPPSM